MMGLLYIGLKHLQTEFRSKHRMRSCMALALAQFRAYLLGDQCQCLAESYVRSPPPRLYMKLISAGVSALYTRPISAPVAAKFPYCDPTSACELPMVPRACPSPP
jgi:hypothetical protein